jgi:hypothetical protein
MAHERNAEPFATFAALVGWIALGLQFYLTNQTVVAQGRSFAATLFVYFGFFTILSNIFAAIALSVAARSSHQSLFARPFIVSGITVSMILVGLVYNLILRQQWHPTGINRVADELLHVVMPLLMVAYWWVFVSKQALQWSDALLWALYPFVYLIYALARGALSATYPYSFIDVGVLGYGTVLVNSVYVTIAFTMISLLCIAAARWQLRPRAGV